MYFSRGFEGAGKQLVVSPPTVPDFTGLLGCFGTGIPPRLVRRFSHPTCLYPLYDFQQRAGKRLERWLRDGSERHCRG